MGILQDVYTDRQPVGWPGMPANSETENDITRTSETVAGIAFGKPAGQGVADLGCIASAVAADKFLGITLRDASLAPTKGDRYTKGSNTTIRTRGAVWVEVSATVAPRDPVYFDFTTQKFTNAANAGANLDLTTAHGWRFDTSAVSGGLAIAVRR